MYRADSFTTSALQWQLEKYAEEMHHGILHAFPAMSGDVLLV